MSLPHSGSTVDPTPPVDRVFAKWRRVHRGAAAVLALLSLLHVGLTPWLYGQWSADVVWFVGTGLGLLLLAGMNVAHVGLGPCDLPTAPAVRVANWVFVAFGSGALLAVPEPQAVLIVVALLAQAIASHWTLSGPA